MKRSVSILLLLFTLGCVTLSGQFAGGAGTPRDPYLVATAQQLNNVRYFLDSHFRQTADIDLGVAPYNTGEGWHPIGIRDLQTGDDIPFTGGFDGGGFNISNLRINRQGTQVNGLFGSVNGAEFRGINLPNLFISGNRLSAGLAVFVIDSEIEDCSVSGSVLVDAFQACAGLVLWLDDSSLKNCRADVTVDFGVGLVGTVHNCGIEDCHVSGTVHGPAGLAGSTYRTLIDRCSSSVAVTGDYRTGGLVGFNCNLSMIVRSYATGKVTGTDSVGGLVGENQTNSAIAQCYATGEVKGEMRVGGLVGNHNHMWMGQPIPTLVIDSFARGKVTGTGQMIGGLIGYAEQSFMNCYSTGEVSGPDDYAGGMAGFSGSNYHGTRGIYSYWDVESSGQHRSNGGLPRPTDELTWPLDSNTFVHWDFNGVWNLDADQSVNDGYPYIRGLPIYVPVNDESLVPPTGLVLSNFPNPFNPSTTISYSVPDNGDVTLNIYNAKGQLVNNLVNEYKNKGNYQVIWNGKDIKGNSVASGLYFTRLVSGGETVNNKMLLMK